jgi:hypothetical protein
MNQMDVIKSYLVSLGFQVDNASYSKMQAAIKELSRAVETHTAGMSGAYLKAAGVITSVLSSITLATAGLMDHLAQSDMEFKKFALRMYMGEDVAKRMKIATDALGESLDDIAWIPELRERYFELLSLEKKMAPPTGYDDQMKHLRDIRYEFTKLKVELAYGAQWVGSYLYKYLNTEIKDFHGWMEKLNVWIMQNMPVWTEKVAGWLVTVWNLAKAVGRAFKDLGEGVKGFWDTLSGEGKLGVIAAGILWLFSKAGPFGRALIILSALTVAVEDFYAFIDGRKSSRLLAPVWYQLLEVSGTAKESVTKLWEAFKGLFATLFGDNDEKLAGSLRNWGSLQDIFDQLAFGIGLVVRGISLLTSALAGLVNAFTHPSQAGSILTETWQEMKQGWDEMGNETARHEAEMQLPPKVREKARRLRLEKQGLVSPKGGDGARVYDNDVDRIADAIKIKESGGLGNSNAKEHGGGPGRGAYQWTGTWDSFSKQYASANNLGDKPLPMTPENQDAVAKWLIKGYIDKGYSPQQIASIWNSGSPNWEGKVGTNKWGKAYNVPAYVKDFERIYNGLQKPAKTDSTQALAKSALRKPPASTKDASNVQAIWDAFVGKEWDEKAITAEVDRLQLGQRNYMEKLSRSYFGPGGAEAAIKAGPGGIPGHDYSIKQDVYVGGITVNVTEPGSSADEIAKRMQDRFNERLRDERSRALRELQPPY